MTSKQDNLFEGASQDDGSMPASTADDPHARTQRISMEPFSKGPAKNWIVEDISVHVARVPPPTAEYRLREEEAARRHDPIIARTLRDGPGNRSRVLACACRERGVQDAVSWCAHVGIPGGERLLTRILRLRDAAWDVLRHPSDLSREDLRMIAFTCKNQHAREEAPWGASVQCPGGDRLSEFLQDLLDAVQGTLVDPGEPSHERLREVLDTELTLGS